MALGARLGVIIALLESYFLRLGCILSELLGPTSKYQLESTCTKKERQREEKATL